MVEAIWQNESKTFKLIEILAEEFVQQLMENVQNDPVYVRHCSEFSEIQKVFFKHDFEQGRVQISFANIDNEVVCTEYLKRTNLDERKQMYPSASTIIYNWLHWIEEAISVAAEDYWEGS